jgi:hypothetical protein
MNGCRSNSGLRTAAKRGGVLSKGYSLSSRPESKPNCRSCDSRDAEISGAELSEVAGSEPGAVELWLTIAAKQSECPNQIVIVRIAIEVELIRVCRKPTVGEGQLSLSK